MHHSVLRKMVGLGGQFGVSFSNVDAAPTSWIHGRRCRVGQIMATMDDGTSSFERSFDVSRVCSYLTNAYANICCKNKCKMLQDFWTFATSLCFSDFSMLHTCFTNFTSEINFRDSKITFRLLSQTT
jgi:hypothetical protein